jgi:hypothetical protein
VSNRQASGDFGEVPIRSVPTGAGVAAIDTASAARYVLSRRTPGGGFCFYRAPRWGVEEPNAPDTLAALESLRLLAVAVAEPQAIAGWLQGVQNDDGGYTSLTIGWAALRALDLLGASPCRSPQAWLSGWADRLLGPAPATRDLRAALGNVSRLAQLMDLSTSQRAAAAQLLAAAADPLGGWARPGADLETTAVAVQLGQLAHLAAPDAAAVEGFLRRCEDPALGARISPQARATTVGALWGGLQLAVLLGIAPRHPAAIAESLARLQRPDGGLGVRHRAVSTLRDTWRGLQASHLLANWAKVDHGDQNRSDHAPRWSTR